MVNASAIPPPLTPSSSATVDDTNNSGQAEAIIRNARMFKARAYGHNFHRQIRSPFSSSIGQHLVPVVHSKIPVEMDFFMDDDDLYDKSKRYDDYGHMRFGKRGDDQFDDYGHMRFGKRAE